MHIALYIADRKSTRLNSSHTVIYTLSLHDALPIWETFNYLLSQGADPKINKQEPFIHACLLNAYSPIHCRSEEHTSELQSHSDLHSFPTRRSSDLGNIQLFIITRRRSKN